MDKNGASGTGHKHVGPDEAAPNQKDGSNRERAARRPYRAEYTTHGRAPANERENTFNLAFWFIEGVTGMLNEANQSDLGLSEEFWVHFYATRRESLLTARALIDTLLDRLDAEANKTHEQQQRRTRRGGVDIDF